MFLSCHKGEAWAKEQACDPHEHWPIVYVLSCLGKVAPPDVDGVGGPIGCWNLKCS